MSSECNIKQSLRIVYKEFEYFRNSLEVSKIALSNQGIQVWGPKVHKYSMILGVEI
jgi:hypothetical protein